jgi:hypothetical protein
MVFCRARRHPMKMGDREKRVNSGVFGGSVHAMNMAWTAIFSSTMFPALSNFNPTR